MKNSLFGLFLLLNATTSAACGVYSVTALVQANQGYPSLLINPGTQSEVKLTLKFADTPKLSAYIDQTISAEIEITELASTSGNIENISKITRNFTSELSQTRGTVLKQLKAAACSN